MTLGICAVLASSPTAAAAPNNPLCSSSGAYRAAHPLICDTGIGSPVGLPVSAGGGSGGGGLLGIVGLGGLL